ncbi:MAG: DUF3574 domain-containing protein [Firmicutes bacterium]|nr:DUF3574 domain-containing protein [Bacillota bacterium]
MTNRRLLAVAPLIILATVFVFAALGTSGEEGIVKYTLYIGLNDKDTYQQEISTEEAEALVEEITLKHADGFTRIIAKGAYKDGAGVVTFENSLIYEFLFVTEEKINRIMDEVLVALNQESILVETQTVDAMFYQTARP